MKILIIEDQESIAKLIKSGLESEGFVADYILDGKDGQLRAELFHKDYDLLLLDLNMPKINGLDVCKNIRKLKISIPIIMLTGKDGNEDIINGLNVGADDYLVKPFSNKILVARIRAILRRPKTTINPIIEIKNLKMDVAGKKIFKNEKEIKLTTKEFSLLEYLIRNQNCVLSKDQILSNVWDFSFDSFSNVVEVHITNIRKKINDHDGLILETVRGMGYRINN
ncbi:MAG: response regulator transcription factor [bacterium]